MFEEISAKEIGGNLIEKISNEWMLITAGNTDGYNMMTASWGFAGEMWGSDTVIAMVRPQRYTMQFLEKEDYFTLSFYGDNKEIHKICGSKSGRDVDKTALTGMTPVFSSEAPYFNEAKTVIICKKQYVQQLDKNCFTDKDLISKFYPSEDYHLMIFGKIEKVLVNAD